jgi:hypothetical protein
MSFVPFFLLLFVAPAVLCTWITRAYHPLRKYYEEIHETGETITPPSHYSASNPFSVVIEPDGWLYKSYDRKSISVLDHSNPNSTRDAQEIAMRICERLASLSLRLRLYCGHTILAIPALVLALVGIFIAVPCEILWLFLALIRAPHFRDNSDVNSDRNWVKLDLHIARLIERMAWPWAMDAFFERFRYRLAHHLDCGVIAPSRPLQFVGAAMAYCKGESKNPTRSILGLEPYVLHPTPLATIGLFWHDCDVTIDHELIHCSQNDLLKTFRAEFLVGSKSHLDYLVFRAYSLMLECHACVFGNFPNPVFLFPPFLIITVAVFGFHRWLSGTYLAGFDTLLQLLLVSFGYTVPYVLYRLTTDSFVKSGIRNR